MNFHWNRIFLAAGASFSFTTGLNGEVPAVRFPPQIKTVAIIAPASQGAKTKVDRGLEILRRAGLKIKVLPHARVKEDSGASAEKAGRIADLEAAWLDPEVDLVLCVRGGKGAEEIVDQLDWERLRKRNVLFLGFSNITCLECAMLTEKAGHPISGPSLSTMGELDATSWQRLCDVLAGTPPAPVKLVPIHAGNARGQALAGHIHMLNIMRKTRFRPETKGKILFLECVGRSEKTLRGILNELRQDNFFKDCAGVVFGHFTNCGDPEMIDRMLNDFGRSLPCPVYKGFPYGHENSNWAIDQTKTAVIENGILSFP